MKGVVALNAYDIVDGLKFMDNFNNGVSGWDY
jgi:hypothetical protein